MSAVFNYKNALAALAVVVLALGVAVLGGYSKSTLPAAVVPAGEQASTTQPAPEVAPLPSFQYIETIDGCGPYFDGAPCINMRYGPGTEYPVVMKLRNGMVLKVVGTAEGDGHTWYKIGFDGEVHYLERVTGDWYVAADYVRLFSDPGASTAADHINASSTKRIIIDPTKEVLYAYDGDTLFMQQPISTGLELTPTQTGTFFVQRKIPDSYMQGPIPGLSDQYYDLPGVPWDLYFTTSGAAIHGAYWHNHFGQPWSHGCVNLPPDQAKLLYQWADLGTPVIVRN